MSARALTRSALRPSSPLSPSSLRRAPRPCTPRTYATEAHPRPVPKPSKFGQPTFQSHPHLLRSHELTPGIPASEYERRRRKLMDGLPDGSLVVSVSAQVKYMSGAIFYKFRQASDFWYLTGFEEPDSAVVLKKDSSARGYTMTLYSLGYDAHKAQWDGTRTDFSSIVDLFGADDARHTQNLAADLKSHLLSASTAYVDLPSSASKRPARGSYKLLMKYLSGSEAPRGVYETILDGLTAPKCKPLAPLVRALRGIKSEYEVEVMRRAAEISGKAHAKTMRLAEPGVSESHLAAHFEYLCARSGSQRPAYVPVVASGENALIIHYTHNDHLLREGELVLVDAGCEYNGYASDITRTFPASGTFTPPQRDLYAALLSAQKSLVALCTAAHGHSLDDLHRQSVSTLRKELQQIGFDLSMRSGLLERVLYPHYLSHPIGIDLHESDTFHRSEPLKEGMVITIEPGVYVPSDPAYPKHFHGLGIRIEDQVLIGKNDPVVLSVAAPKEIADVEGSCQGVLGLEPF
ncbi:Metallo peptidase M24B [Heterobasidion irregulare TC 32-1]|uniref:Metallo peptidase M24B n=1 Tax=Heterobasidion irregulare (strain TC 32-1) TaxID=747525 RepID=W4KH17_HETIT|nr:Metallo peptidase M24B [Heterobasidion irregulare TC 32-1]ETW84620.1 Metallo peptidase M24B [Heterobasidion irregulare TC 32-1]